VRDTQHLPPRGFFLRDPVGDIAEVHYEPTDVILHLDESVRGLSQRHEPSE
jgi:hypothetical protein